MTLKVERVDIGSLHQDPNNARKHPEKNLASIKASLNKFGQVEPLVVNEKNNTVIGGNGRLEAMKAMGWTTVDIVKVDLNSVDAAHLGLVLNQTGILAEWDQDILTKTLGGLMDEGVEIEDFGFNIDDFDFPGMGTEGKTDEDEVPEVPQNVHNVQRGDIYLLGEHRVMCGDSTVKENVEKLMDGQKADMVFTDPPYGMNLDTDYSKMPRGATTFKKVIGDDRDYDPSHIFETVQAARYCIWGADWFYEKLPKGYSPVVWDKQPYECEAGPQNHFELCWIFPKEKRRTIRKLWTGFTAKEKGEKRVHPTQKPVDLCVDLLERGGKQVVDLFLGSGSTLIACEKTGRKCYGMELDPHYVSVIIERWQNFTGKQAVKV